YPESLLLDARLKVIKPYLQPTYRSETSGSAYPLTQRVEVPLPVVYGRTGDGYSECFLPLIYESFRYQDEKQFDALLQYMAINKLNSLSPEKLYRLMAYPMPYLDHISLKVNTFREYTWGDFFERREYPTLSRLAEQYPFPKATGKGRIATIEAAWEMEDKVAEAHEKLTYHRANVIIVGAPGSGKSAVLSQVIKQATSQAKKQRQELSFWRLLPQRITAGAKYLGEWQEICELLVEELQSAGGILWIVDIVRLFQAGGQSVNDSIAAFLLSFLQQGKLQITGEATPQELESMQRMLPGFIQACQIVQLPELPEQKVLSIMERFAEYCRNNYGVKVESQSIQLAFRLMLRYYPYESFPGKGIKFLGQCISEAQLNERTTVGKEDLIAQFIRQTGLPELFLRDDQLLNVGEVRSFFEGRIIGQKTVVDHLCNLVKVYKAGLNNPYKPISTLIFAGPTGVGKTESAKALADYFFGKGQKNPPLIRIDMSEFQYPGQIGRLIGEGNTPGQLVREVREKPFSVILLDEVEKADSSVFDALFNALDEGLLVDAFGRVTNFRNTIIILTTNLGASGRRSLSFSETTPDDTIYLSAISKHFRQEFINRIDGIVLFNTLSANDIRMIALKELNALRKREGIAKRRLTLEFDETLVDQLVETGFDKNYGARPLQRAIQRQVVSALGDWLLAHPGVYDATLRVLWNKTISISFR
ncbi:MAG: ATP-dependent Clp protease ATP-binding subunit, partial [Saprospiraceae bacterium]|nr:ATP-dependent Clp protease ATP-binding subunit [Saprospiraceae bacterium]